MAQAPQTAPAPIDIAADITQGTDRPSETRIPTSHQTRSIGRFHPIPVIGHPESFYLKHAQEAEKAGDRHARSSHKVGQYVTTALTPGMAWSEKIHRFLHALDKYCVAPAGADESLRAFYQKLADIVRRYAGQEAVTVARRTHEGLLGRMKNGVPREILEDEAEFFFFDMLGHHQCPDWCCKEAYRQIIGWRDFWI
jgi:hypothetical protein